MASYTLILHVAVAVLASNLVYGAVNQVPLPTINLTEWWGPNGTTFDTSINDYTITFNASMISDLISRLESHRPFAPPLEGVAFNYGFNSTVLKTWIKYVAEEYPFQDRATYLNQYSHYTTYIQGLKIHFMRIQTQNTSYTLTPLLLLHGWPGSFREFYETIPYLLSFSKAKGFALDIIVPSLPGFGFSDGALRVGLGVDKAAIVCRNLMHRIGYEQYYVQGGGMGSMIASAMATFFTYDVLGLHSNMALYHTPEMVFDLIIGNYHKEEVAQTKVLKRLYPSWTRFFDLMTETGYLHIQATKPDTVGIGLSDSPSGLIAYTLEKFSTGVRRKFINHTDGGLTEVFTKAQLIDNVMIYWVSNCMTTAMRLYAETFNTRYTGLRLNEIRTPVPIWVTQAPDEYVYLPGWLIRKKFTNLVNETLPSEGGHFYAWERPKPFAEDVVDAIVAFKDWHAKNSTLYTKCSSYISN